MPVSRRIASDILNEIRAATQGIGLEARLASRPPSDAPAPPPIRCGRGAPGPERRRALLSSLGVDLPVLTGERTVIPPDGFRGNIENFIGLAQVPVGLAGPLRVNGLHAQGDYYVPLATTEGTLVASHARGAAVITRSGGARSLCMLQRVTRAPGFRFTSMVEAGRFVAFALDSFATLQAVAAETSRHGRLEDLRVHWDGNLVYLLCDYSTGDAAGQNMVTLATDRIVAHLVERGPVRPTFWTVESNLSGDKKATALAFQYVRGKRVIAEVELPRRVVEDALRTTPEAMEEYWKAAFVASSQSGSIGAQGQFANGLAALFLACGQDVACVAEAAVGNSRFEASRAGLYVSVCLPSLIVGTVGGGTATPTARECLGLLGCVGNGTGAKLAEIAAALVLAGEISINAALTRGTFARAHAVFGRKHRAARALTSHG
jgi:hydroxymethylglutaryl-CoA reductase (NADPH)